MDTPASGPQSDPRQSPLVTIAIPTYNRADTYLPAVMQAALAQTWPRLEILVGDNASTDNTPEFVRSIDDPRVRYIRHSKNIGGNNNFNHLLQSAKGDWFLLLHDDDLIDSDFVESCMTTVTPDSNFGFICTGVRSIDAAGNVLKRQPSMVKGSTRDDFFLSWFRMKTGLYLCSTLYHTERLKEVGGFHSLHNLLEDNFALCKLLRKWDYGQVTEIKASYRYTFDQRTYSVPVLEWCEDFDQLLDMIVDSTSTEQKMAVRHQGKRFFGRLCVMRANALASFWRWILARLQIARYFGLQTLRHRWKRIR